MSASPDAASAAAARELAAAGLDLQGCLPVARYDACVPPAWRSREVARSARSALLLAAGGRALFAAFAKAPEAQLSHDPLDAYTRRVVETAAGHLDARAVFAFERRSGVCADFVALGRAAGLGAPSRLGLLLHPVYGPWLSLRALLLTPRLLPETPPLADFDPCRGCAATRRRRAGCRERCDARRACVVGREHAYAATAEAHHMRSLPGP